MSLLDFTTFNSTEMDPLASHPKYKVHSFLGFLLVDPLKTLPWLTLSLDIVHLPFAKNVNKNISIIMNALEIAPIIPSKWNIKMGVKHAKHVLSGTIMWLIKNNENVVAGKALHKFLDSVPSKIYLLHLILHHKKAKVRLKLQLRQVIVYRQIIKIVTHLLQKEIILHNHLFQQLTQSLILLQQQLILFQQQLQK